MNDAHDNAQIDKEMLARRKQHEAMTYPYEEPEARFREGGVVRPNPIHTDRSVQHMDIRIYFGEEMAPEDVRDTVAAVLQESGDLSFMISAFELVNDGFAHLTPDSRPLA